MFFLKKRFGTAENGGKKSHKVVSPQIAKNLFDSALVLEKNNIFVNVR